LDYYRRDGKRKYRINAKIIVKDDKDYEKQFKTVLVRDRRAGLVKELLTYGH